MTTRKWPDVHYQQVAEVYEEAFAVSAIGTDRAVAETWGVNITTAARWVKRARQLGFLAPPAIRCSGRCALHCCGQTGHRRRTPDRGED